MFLNFFLYFVIFKLVFVTPLLGLFLSIFSCLLRAFYSHPPWRCWTYTANIHLQEMWCEVCNWVKVFNCHTFWALHLTLRLHPAQEGPVYGLWVSWEGYQSQAVSGHCGTSVRDRCCGASHQSVSEFLRAALQFEVLLPNPASLPLSLHRCQPWIMGWRLFRALNCYFDIINM